MLCFLVSNLIDCKMLWLVFVLFLSSIEFPFATSWPLSAHAATAGFVSCYTAAQEPGRLCLQLCSPNNRLPLVALAEGREEGIFSRMLPAAVCECQQLEAKACSLQIEERAAAARRARQDKVTDKNTSVLSNMVPAGRFYSSWGQGLSKHQCD